MPCKCYSHFFSKKFQHTCVSLGVNFNELLTNGVVSFEQLDPGLCFPFIRSVVSNDSVSRQWRPWSDRVDAQADLGLCGRICPKAQPIKVFFDFQGWGMYAQLLIDLFKFLSPFLRNADLTKPTHFLYKVIKSSAFQVLAIFGEILIPLNWHFSYKIKHIFLFCFCIHHIFSEYLDKICLSKKCCTRSKYSNNPEYWDTLSTDHTS